MLRHWPSGPPCARYTQRLALSEVYAAACPGRHPAHQVSIARGLPRAKLVPAREQRSLNGRGRHPDLGTDLGQGQALPVELGGRSPERLIHSRGRPSERLLGPADDSVDSVVADFEFLSDVFDQLSSTVAGQHLVGSPLVQLVTWDHVGADLFGVEADGGTERVDTIPGLGVD